MRTSEENGKDGMLLSKTSVPFSHMMRHQTGVTCALPLVLLSFWDLISSAAAASSISPVAFPVVLAVDL